MQLSLSEHPVAVWNARHGPVAPSLVVSRPAVMSRGPLVLRQKRVLMSVEELANILDSMVESAPAAYWTTMLRLAT